MTDVLYTVNTESLLAHSRYSLNSVDYISEIFVFLTNTKLLRNKAVYSFNLNTVRAFSESQKKMIDD